MKRTLPRLLATLLCLALLFAMAACGAPDNTQSTPVSDSGSASTEPVQTADTSTPTYGGTMTMSSTTTMTPPCPPATAMPFG